MKIFFAGNFPQMSKPEFEAETSRRVLSISGRYCRLISFFYKDPWSMNVLIGLNRIPNEKEKK